MAMTTDLPRLWIVDDDDAILITARVALRRHFSVVDTLNEPASGQTIRLRLTLG